MIDVLGEDTQLPNVCSRSGCTESAVWGIAWRNPRIHSEDRRKVWLACEAHLEYLRSFLEARSFPLDVLPFEKLKEQR